MAIDVKRLFDVELPERLARNAEDARALGATFQMNLHGLGEWNIDVSASGPSCRPGTGPAACTITVFNPDDCQKLIESPTIAGPQLFITKKIKIAGNQMLAMKLGKVFGFR